MNAVVFTIRTAFAATFAVLVAVVGLPREAHAIDIQEVVSPHGISAWLVEDPTAPLIAMAFSFAGGAAQDPPDKPGVANLMSALLDEGAGDLDSEAFQARLDDLSIRMSFDAGRDDFSGSLTTLVENRDEAFRLLRLALTEPRFDDEAVERIKAQMVSGIRGNERDPGRLASTALMQTAFPHHPYGRDMEGTTDSVAAVTVDDLRTFHGKTIARDHLDVVVVGAIDAATLSGALDQVFGGLPVKANLRGIADTVPEVVDPLQIESPDPQTIIRFIGPGPKRHDPDFIATVVASYILGGGPGSRLYDEVREDRGLAYGVYAGVSPLEHAGFVAAGTSTRGDQAAAAVALIEDEMSRFAAEGPTEKELADAKAYLIGSYPLGFTTSGVIARRLLAIKVDDLGIDYVNQRNDQIAAVTLDEVKAAAARYFDGERLFRVTVGQPSS